MTVVALEGAAIGSAAPSARGPTTLQVHDAAMAADALRQAMTGTDLILLADAPRAVLDALYDDLRRITQVEIRTSTPVDAGPGVQLTDVESQLLALLADGWTLREAAETLHLSPRSSDRRLASARRKLGAATTTAAIAAFRRGT